MSGRPLSRALLLVALAGMLVACGPSLPEPDSLAAQAYARRCNGCHRVFAPGSMTYPMWEMQIDRMRRIFAQQGLPWLGADEDRAIREYLRRHAGTS